MSIIYINPFQFAAAAPTDPYFSNVSLLLHGDGTNGSTTIVDSSPTPLILTSQSSAEANISTAESVFGGSSLYFSGGFNGYIYATANAKLWFGTENFTVECFARRIDYANPYQEIISVFSDASNTGNPVGYGWTLGLDTQLKFKAVVFNNNTTTNSSITSSNSTVVGQWYHVAFVRNGSIAALYVDGLNVGTVTLSDGFNIAPNPDTLLNIGTYGNRAFGNSFGGYIDELRITKGVARYTSNFTPPTAPFPDA